MWTSVKLSGSTVALCKSRLIGSDVRGFLKCGCNEVLWEREKIRYNLIDC